MNGSQQYTRPCDAQNRLKWAIDMEQNERSELLSNNLPTKTILAQDVNNSSRWNAVQPNDDDLTIPLLRSFCGIFRDETRYPDRAANWRLAHITDASVTRLMAWCIDACQKPRVPCYPIRNLSSQQIVDDVRAAASLRIHPGLLKMPTSCQTLSPRVYILLWATAERARHYQIAQIPRRDFQSFLSSCTSDRQLAIGRLMAMYTAVEEENLEGARRPLMHAIRDDVNPRRRGITIDQARLYYDAAPGERFKGMPSSGPVMASGTIMG